MLSIESRLCDVYSQHLHSCNHDIRSMLCQHLMRYRVIIRLLKHACDVLYFHHIAFLEEKPFNKANETRSRKRKSRRDTSCAWNSTTRDEGRRELASPPPPPTTGNSGNRPREPRVFFRQVLRDTHIFQQGQNALYRVFLHRVNFTKRAMFLAFCLASHFPLKMNANVSK